MNDSPLEGKTLYWCMTGSFCTVQQAMKQVELVQSTGVNIIPVFSYMIYATDTRFGQAYDIRKQIEGITGNKVLCRIVDVEPIGPMNLADLVVIAPCTGNTISKLVNGIVDTPVLMAAKSQLRNQKPVVIALATNDALGNNAVNIAAAIDRPNIYMVPLGQDDAVKKPRSMVAHMSLLPQTIMNALDGKQVRPVFQDYE